MTSILKEEDKVFTMYNQYKELIHRGVEKNDNRVYGTDQLAAQLTVAHMLDHIVCLNIFKEDKPPTARKVNKTWEKKFDNSAEVEIMRNSIEERGGFNLDENETPPSPAWVTVKTYVPLDSAVEERRNQFEVTSSSSNVEIDWKRGE